MMPLYFATSQMPERMPHPNGVLDRRLGVSSKLMPGPPGRGMVQSVCETCGEKLADCAGHFGYIKLELPVFHIGYFKNTLQILQSMCKSCARLLLPDEERLQVRSTHGDSKSCRPFLQAKFIDAVAVLLLLTLQSYAGLLDVACLVPVMRHCGCSLRSNCCVYIKRCCNSRE